VARGGREYAIELEDIEARLSELERCRRENGDTNRRFSALTEITATPVIDKTSNLCL
jgi:hypothetical protein